RLAQRLGHADRQVLEKQRAQLEHERTVARMERRRNPGYFRCMRSRHTKPATLLAIAAAVLAAWPAAAETLKIASPPRGSWEGAIPELGKSAGIFQKHGLDLEVLYTSGSGETVQVVIAGAVNVGLSAGTVGAVGAFAKGAPIRIIGASETGSLDTFWYV